jgi:hypothetical protein
MHDEYSCSSTCFGQCIDPAEELNSAGSRDWIPFDEAILHIDVEESRTLSFYVQSVHEDLPRRRRLLFPFEGVRKERQLSNHCRH